MKDNDIQKDESRPPDLHICPMEINKQHVNLTPTGKDQVNMPGPG